MIDLAKEQPLTVDQACEMFNISRGTLDNWFDAGLGRVKIGRRVYTTREAVQRHAADLAERNPGDNFEGHSIPSQSEISRFEAEAARAMFEARHPKLIAKRHPK